MKNGPEVFTSTRGSIDRTHEEWSKLLGEIAEELGTPSSAPLWFYTQQVAKAAELIGMPDELLALWMVEWMADFLPDSTTLPSRTTFVLREGEQK